MCPTLPNKIHILLDEFNLLIFYLESHCFGLMPSNLQIVLAKLKFIEIKIYDLELNLL